MEEGSYVSRTTSFMIHGDGDIACFRVDIGLRRRPRWCLVFLLALFLLLAMGEAEGGQWRSGDVEPTRAARDERQYYGEIYAPALTTGHPGTAGFSPNDDHMTIHVF